MCALKKDCVPNSRGCYKTTFLLSIYLTWFPFNIFEMISHNSMATL